MKTEAFCKCCTSVFKRKSATFLDGEHEIYFLTFGMCKLCWIDANPGINSEPDLIVWDSFSDNSIKDPE